MASKLPNRVLLLFLAMSIQLIWITSTNQLVEAAEGGPSSFGYDASSACSKPFNRVARARVENLPCDFSRESWCTIAGNDYPWHAVRRFVQENQGLMRRMYGDERHMSVLKNELEKEDVEVEVEGDSNHLYNDDISSRYSRYSYGYEDNDFEGSEDEEYERLIKAQRGRSMSTGSSSKLEKPAVESVSRVHPNEAPTVSSTTTHSSSVSSSTPSSTSTSNPSSTTPTTTPTTRETTSTIKSTSTNHTTKIFLPVTSAFSPSTDASTTTSSSSPRNSSFNEIDRMDVNVDDLTEIPESTTFTSFADDEDDEDEVEDLRVISTSENPEEIPKVVALRDQEGWNDSQSMQPQQFRPRPEYRPTEPTKTEGGNMEGQLFQAVDAKDKQEAVLKVRGINACPTKIEMIAPFWGNSTRGEILALLNLYPFEQYVHYEKCTNENKQMYCRDGCRCEQQYRVHRLLAYDPNNECRGIFSDWFRFPSCCTCHCYDLPLEFRVTSRSPRTNLISSPKQKVKVRAPNPPPLQSKRRRRGSQP